MRSFPGQEGVSASVASGRCPVITGKADLTSGVEQRLDSLNAKLDELLEWYKAVNFRASKRFSIRFRTPKGGSLISSAPMAVQLGEIGKLLDKFGSRRLQGGRLIIGKPNG